MRDKLFPVFYKTTIFFQGGVTEEQMLKFMGANTKLSPLQAKQLIEVSVQFIFLITCSDIFG